MYLQEYTQWNYSSVTKEWKQGLYPGLYEPRPYSQVDTDTFWELM